MTAIGSSLEPPQLTPEQVAAFDRDGFLIVEAGLVPERALPLLRERFLRLFDGEYETGISPDEVNWVRGRDPEDRTRQICNGWKADTVVAAQVLSERTAELDERIVRQIIELEKPAHVGYTLHIRGVTDEPSA